MDRQKTKQIQRLRRRHHVRKRIVGTSERPRLTVFRSSKHIYAQLIDDLLGFTLVAASPAEEALRGSVKYGGNVKAAQEVGKRLAEAARMIQDLGFDIIDLNLGCPAKKVVKCGGSGLLRDLPALEVIFKRIRTAVTIPFTVKIRTGWSDEEIVAVPVARLAEACGVEAIAVHGRTRLQGYSGRARWDIIAEVKAAVRIPVIGNGDVFTPPDAEELYKQTGCDAVMIGRAAPTNPWIFRQMSEHFATGTYTDPGERDRYELIRTYYRMLVAEDIPGAIGKMKQFASWFTHGVRNGAVLRKSVQSAGDPKEVLDRVDEFFLKMHAGDDLAGEAPAPAAAVGAGEIVCPP